MITKAQTIFAFLVERLSPLIERYMYLISDEFIDQYKDDLKNFDGFISRFTNFERTIDRYFII